MQKVFKGENTQVYKKNPYSFKKQMFFLQFIEN